MGVLPVVLMILAMKIPIFGLLWFVFWVGRAPEESDAPGEKLRGRRPRRPEPPLRRGPRRRGPHGGGAVRAQPACEDGVRTRARGPAARPLPATRHAPAVD